VLACVSVVGTTEESAVDRLDRIAAVRTRAARDGVAFYLHADAAYGGYSAAITREPDGSRARSPEGEWPDRQVFDALCALEQTDSVTIDPHKLGYVPYPAGAISFRDRRVRELGTVEAPYVFHPGLESAGQIGRYILEGSKPGAAAAAVWLSHRVLPLDRANHGRLIAETARGARALHARLREASWGDFRVVLPAAPDLNIVNFAIQHPRLHTIERHNAFIDRLHTATTRTPNRSEYLISKTTLRAHEYGVALRPMLDTLGFSFESYQRDGGLRVARCTVMNPLFAAGRGRVDFVDGFLGYLGSLLPTLLPE
jgi:glutamate/tyrosine decarboxylase-like PLP-dependent enzyme